MMNTKDYLKDIYCDFFGVESLKGEHQEYSGMNDKKEDSQEKMTHLFEQINQLYITDASKELLKKMIEYMRKYSEKIEANYIPFSFLIEVNNDQLRKDVENILLDAVHYFSYLEKFEKKSVSLYQLESNLDFFKSDFLTIYDVSGFQFVDDKEKNQFFYQLENVLKENDKRIVMIAGTCDEFTNFFFENEKLRDQYFEFRIVGVNPKKTELYQMVLDHVQLDDSLKKELFDYIDKTYHEECDYVTYEKNLIQYLSFEKSVPKIEKAKSLDEIFADLNELVGLKKVKKVLYELVDLIQLKENAGDSLKIKNLNLHMVFLGNPGTGKTTIARIVTDILYHLNYIKENKLIEVSSKDLIAEYVGQTAPKTMQVIEKSFNGVLFIDEAYTLASTDNHSYQSEAIATLIQAMENYRDKLVVIFAGYTKEMQEFLNSNSGIASRIGYTLEFDDYTTEELIQIFLGMMEKSGFVVENEAISYFKEIIQQYRNMKNFGNARFVRNVYEKTIIQHASRVKNQKDQSILNIITKEDISIENLILKS